MIGIVAALAIPAFIGYLQRSKEAEARSNLGAICHGAADAASADPRVPPSLPRTPAAVGSRRQVWPADAPAAWAELGFAPVDPLYFAYAFERLDDRRFVVRAFGDLDGDGDERELTVSGTLGPDGTVSCGPVTGGGGD